jgi:hypothetical protein
MGVTPEFFTPTTLAPDAEVVIENTYSPTVGLTNVTHANREYLTNFYVDDGAATLQLFSTLPERPVHAMITSDSEIIYEMPAIIDPAVGHHISVEIPNGTETLAFAIQDEPALNCWRVNCSATNLLPSD